MLMQFTLSLTLKTCLGSPVFHPAEMNRVLSDVDHRLFVCRKTIPNVFFVFCFFFVFFFFFFFRGGGGVEFESDTHETRK